MTPELFRFRECATAVGLFSFLRRRGPVDDVPPAPPGDDLDGAEDTTEFEAIRTPSDRPISGGESAGFRWAQLSITGNFRDNNEDSIAVDQQGRFFLVADGMGGQMAGEKASAMAVEHVAKRLDASLDSQPAEAVGRGLKSAIADANSEIMALGNVEPAYNGMGTTIVALVRAADGLVIGSVGDSRIYRLRDGQLKQLTRDDSLIQALIDAGTITPSEAKEHRYKNMLVKYLGAKEGAEGGDPTGVDAQPGDRFLLCSDGVTDGVDDDAIETLLAASDPEPACRSIVRSAQDGGSRDNISCIVVEVTG